MTEQPGEENEEDFSPSAELLPYYTVHLLPDEDEWGESHAPDDYETEYYRSRVPMYDVHYDLERRMWVCNCSRFLSGGNCLHSYRHRGETVVKANEEYL